MPSVISAVPNPARPDTKPPASAPKNSSTNAIELIDAPAKIGEGSGVVAPNPVVGAIGPDRSLTVDKHNSHRLNCDFRVGRNGLFRTPSNPIGLHDCCHQCCHRNQGSGNDRQDLEPAPPG